MFTLELIKLSFGLFSVPMLLASARGEIVLANDELVTLFGYEGDELLGRKIDVLVPQSVRKHHGMYVDAYMHVPTKRVMGQGRALMGVAKSGHDIPLELALNTVEIDGQLFSIVVAVDLSTQLSHQSKMELAMEAATSAMIMVNSGGEIVLVNAAAESLTGYDREELLGNTIEMLIAKDIRLSHRVYRTSYAISPDKRSMSRGRQISLQLKEGGTLPVEISLTPVSTPEGEMVMSTVFDLTERLESEQAIRVKNEALDTLNCSLTEKNRELSQFTYAVSHDLKAPLASILGLLSIAREDFNSGQQDEIAETIDRAIALCERHGKKVERILRFSRDVEAEAPVAVDLRKIIAETWDGIAPGAKVSVDLTCDLEVDTIMTGRTAVEAILQNLLSNAVNYHDPQKEQALVRVTALEVDGVVEISVEDNGVGIPENYHDKVFEVFRRVDQRGGDGIGLAMVQKHVARLGGRITLESKVGTGTIFRVFLPSKKGDELCQFPY